MRLTNNGWKNVVGTSGESCSPCGAWLDHWKKLSKIAWPSKCSVEKCNSAPTVGAHVIHDSSVEHEFIIPMCSACNANTALFNIRLNTRPVTAEKCRPK